MKSKLKGSIQEVPLKSGDTSYKVTIDLPATNGERNRETRTFPTEEEAYQWQVEMNHRLLNGNDDSHFDPGEMKLGEYLESWYKSHCYGLKRSTKSKYRYHLDNLIPAFGEVLVRELTPYHIETFYHEKEEDGLSTTTIRGFGKTLRMALNKAVRQGMIKKNPSKVINLPPVEKKEMQFLLPDQVEAFLQEVGNHWPYRGLFQLAITGGLRRGELLGLKWKDIDFDEGRVKVRRQLLIDWDYEFYFEDPKTDKSRRTVEIPFRTVEILKQHRDQRDEFMAKKDEWPNPELVFTSMSGTILMPRNIRKNLKKHLNR